MADHVFVKVEKLAAASLGLLDRQAILGGLITRDGAAQFTGAAGDTVNIKRPATLIGSEEQITRSKTREIETENLNEWKIAVKLDTHAYSAVDLSDAELTLDIEDFGAQVLDPQVKSIVRRIEKKLAAKLETAPAIGTVAVDAATGDEVNEGAVRKMVVRARNRLNRNDVPVSGRKLVVGADVESALLNDPMLVRFDTSNSTTVLRESTIGRLAGFDIVVSNDIAPDTAIALHPTAYVLVNRAPVIPAGVTYGATRSHENLAMRLIRDYNSKTASDRSFLSTYLGIGEITDAPEGTVPGTEEDNAKQLRAVSFKLVPGA